MGASERLLKAVAVTAELMGTDMSEAAAGVFAEDLSRYPLEQVLPALQRCRREVKGRLILADVISRLDDGRPGPEEAWSMIPRDESASVVWTAEMARAFGPVIGLLEAGDAIAARMAFLESYRANVARARDAGEPVSWSPSFGTDIGGREVAVRQAVDKGRIGRERAVTLIGPIDFPDAPQSLAWLTGEAERRAISDER